MYHTKMKRSLVGTKTSVNKRPKFLAVTNNTFLQKLQAGMKKLQSEKKKPRTRIMSRKYDTAKHAELTLLDIVEKNNVIFDKEASDKKKEIFGDGWKNTCILTGTTKQLSVDHIYPIRGAYGNQNQIKTGWLENGLRGSDSQWNTIMVIKSKNSGFKIFNHTKTHGWKKDISFEKLTSEELNQCTPQERDLYVKIHLWRIYAEKRGASFCWQFEKETNMEIEQIYTDIYKLLEERILKLDVKIVSPSRVHERLASTTGADVSTVPIVELQKKAQSITSYFNKS